MAGYNKLILMGNLTRDPQFERGTNTDLVRFGIATNKRWKTKGGEDREEVMFIDCTAFGKLAEIIDEYCTKGKLVLLEGELRYETWESDNGDKRSKHTMTVHNMQMVGPREDSGGGGRGRDDDRGGFRSDRRDSRDDRSTSRRESASFRTSRDSDRGDDRRDTRREDRPREESRERDREPRRETSRREEPRGSMSAPDQGKVFDEPQPFKDDDIPF
jgi:single-strand DNA-binding protein